MNRRTCLAAVALAAIAFACFVPGCDTLVTEKTVIIEAGHPIADFAAVPTVCCAPCTVTFADSSRGPRQLWMWSFGDHKDSVDDSTANPVHVYDSGGIFQVSLTILDTTVEDTGRDTETKNYYITVGTTSADFDAQPDTACLDREVTMRPPEAGGIFRWEWDFRDDSTETYSDSMPDSIVHAYDSAGTYWVRLVVTDSCGSRTDSELVVVIPCPTVKFFANVIQGCKPLEVTFHDSSVAPYPISSRDWDFGDGQTDTGQNPTVTYSDPGIYTVSLTIRDTGGGTATDSIVDYITVYDSASAQFSAASNTAGCHSEFQQFLVQFTNESSGNLDTITWSFGDGMISNDTNPVHAFVDPGAYAVKLRVAGWCGVDSIIKDSFIILADTLTNPAFSITPDTVGDTTTLFTFVDQSSGYITGWSWNFGDDSTAIGDSVTHIYTHADTFEVKLTITNPCGSVEAIDTVIVTE